MGPDNPYRPAAQRMGLRPKYIVRSIGAPAVTPVTSLPDPAIIMAISSIVGSFD